MSTALAIANIRLPLNMRSHDRVKDALTNAAPAIWRGTDVKVDVLIQVGATVVDSFTGIAKLVLEVHTTTRADSAIVRKEVLAAALTSCTSGEWTAGSKQHATFNLDAADTQVSLDATTQINKSTTFWLVVYAILTSGDLVTLGAADLTIEEDGVENDLPVSGAATPAYRVADGELQLWNPDQETWHTVYIRGLAGAEQLVIGPGEA